jgi:DNA-directed RNA polymerase subunit RPC12/RpoP
MSQATYECEKCKKTFVENLGNNIKECPYCGHKKLIIIDIAF